MELRWFGPRARVLNDYIAHSLTHSLTLILGCKGVGNARAICP